MQYKNQNERPPSSLSYRPDIDGLRAIAVLPVILFHAGFDLFSGGFVGVDVFFVISGYLITSIIIKELNAGNFSLGKFYERRARRILPALFVVLAVSTIFAWFWMTATEMQSFSQSLVAVSIYASNILFWITRDYFSTAAELEPLLHTWTLGIEEQYYVVFPILMVLLWKAKWLIVPTLCIVTVISFVTSDWLSLRDADTNFYLLHTRAWELLVGSLVAIALARDWIDRDNPNTGKRLLSCIGLVMIFVAVISFDESLPFPGRYAALPVVGTAFVIAFSDPSSLTSRLLSVRGLVLLGITSYSAYLWHHAIFAFARIRTVDELNGGHFLGLIMLTLFVAYLSWRFIENPVRRARVTRRQIFSGALAGSLLFIVIGWLGHATGGFPNRFDDQEVKLVETAAASPKRDACHTSGRKYLAPENACVFVTDREPSWAVWGDSHGVELAYALAESLELQNESLTQLTFSNCGADYLGKIARRDNPGCAQWLTETVNWLSQHETIEKVVVAFNHQPKANRSDAAFENGQEVYFENLRKLIERLVVSGKKVVMVQPIPSLSVHIQEFVFFRSNDGSGSLSELPLETHIEKNLPTRNFILEMQRQYPAQVSIVDPAEALCNESICLRGDEDELFYFDSHHLSLPGAERIVSLINNE